MTESDINIDSQQKMGSQGPVGSFYKAVVAELKLVTWPERSHVLKSSLVVIIFCISVSVFVGVLDYLLTFLMVLINRVL